MSDFSFALLITTLAGLSTGIGGLIAISTKKENPNFLTFSLGFSAGVMIYVSFVEILPSSSDIATEAYPKLGEALSTLLFFAGILFIAFIDRMIPEESNPHEFSDGVEDKKLMRVGVFTAIAIAIHNFPEGLATFIASYSDPKLAFPIAVAIALHNIPEGVGVAAPIYRATGDKKKAFLYSFTSGLAEPVGGLVGFLVLAPFLNELVLAGVLSFVAGIMVYISIDELLPAARAYGKHHVSIAGFILGMFIMAVSLLVL
ncbi:MAG: zinc transporter ZupT [Campylobacteraceae bacterium]|nr:zinc transporter ZupT [Campylobacteraceae bacterium]